jgi:hypothetical protein
MKPQQLLEFLESVIYQTLFEASLPTFDPKTKSRFIDTLVQKAIENPKFHSWFNGSKVVDREGKPMLVFHATSREFTAFASSAANTGGTSINTNFLGFFFTNSADVASTYIAKQFNPDKGFKPNAQVGMFFLKMTKPLFISEKQYWKISRMSQDETMSYVAQLKEKGHDGIIMPSVWRGKGKGYDFVVFDNQNIRSATDFAK